MWNEKVLSRKIQYYPINYFRSNFSRDILAGHLPFFWILPSSSRRFASITLGAIAMLNWWVSRHNPRSNLLLSSQPLYRVSLSGWSTARISNFFRCWIIIEINFYQMFLLTGFNFALLPYRGSFVIMYLEWCATTKNACVCVCQRLKKMNQF